MKLGVIADDFTGASDVAGFLVDAGLTTILTSGIPEQSFDEAADACVISLKTRSVPASEAVTLSLQALERLKDLGCDRFYFKYCSTFDSTPEGNIGPVTDALLDALGQKAAIICPALPVNGRTVYRGYLFVGDLLLQESGMKDHPITPMNDSKLKRLMEQQGSGSAGEIEYEIIESGQDGIRRRIDKLTAQGIRYLIPDVLSADHLQAIAGAAETMPLLTGGSGLAPAAASRYFPGRRAAEEAAAIALPGPDPTVVLSASCSTATNRQVDYYREMAPSLVLDPERILNDPGYLNELINWFKEHLGQDSAPMLYATQPPEKLKSIRKKLGAEKAAGAVEQMIGKVAIELQSTGVRNFIVAGGETSGTVVQSLGIRNFHIGPQIAPGVPWIKAVGGELCFALKSGNFGTDDFFSAAQQHIRRVGDTDRGVGKPQQTR